MAPTTRDWRSIRVCATASCERFAGERSISMRFWERQPIGKRPGIARYLEAHGSCDQSHRRRGREAPRCH